MDLRIMKMKSHSLTVGRIFAVTLLMLAAPVTLSASEETKHPIPVDWSWNEGPLGVTGQYDQAALQRGLQVYRDVCAACHGLKFVAFRTLGDKGGPGYNEAEIEAIAAEYYKPSLDEYGDPGEEIPRLPSDYFPDPYANEVAARFSNSGALPPDLSLITKARVGGADYINSLLIGFEDEPDDVEMGEGMYYNPYFSGHQIAMAPPLFEDSVEYADGTPATVEQMSSDVTQFLMWAAEPKLEERKQIGFSVIGYLIILSVLLFFTYRRIWRDQH
jgi:cytochrome c1